MQETKLSVNCNLESKMRDYNEQKEFLASLKKERKDLMKKINRLETKIAQGENNTKPASLIEGLTDAMDSVINCSFLANWTKKIRESN